MVALERKNLMIHIAAASGDYLREFLVQLNRELNENLKGVKKLFDFNQRKPASPGFTALDSTATGREQHHTHYLR